MPGAGEIWVNTRTDKRYRIVSANNETVSYTGIKAGSATWVLGLDEFKKRFKKED